MGGCSWCRVGLGNPYSTRCVTALPHFRIVLSRPASSPHFGEGIVARAEKTKGLRPWWCPLRQWYHERILPVFRSAGIIRSLKVHDPRLERWGYAHKSVNHGRGEYARDEDGDGFCEVHVNTMEGFWSLLRS